MDVDIAVLELESLLHEGGFHQADRCLRRLSHDVADLAGQVDLACTLHGDRLNEEDLAAGLRPGKSGDDARRRVLHDLVVIDLLLSEIILDVFLPDDQLALCEGGLCVIFRLVLGVFIFHREITLDDLHRSLAADRQQLLLKPADARLARVIRNDLADRAVRKADIVLRETRLGDRLGHQMALRDLKMLHRRVARQLDDLHAVKQRLRDRIPGVGRADEEYMREVVGQVHIVVVEGAVLFRIQHFKQRRARVPVKASHDLVDLVEHDHRVHDACPLDAGHDTAGHGADIGAPVAADLRLVADAAQGNADILAAQRLRHGFAHGGLAGTGCAHEQQDRAVLLAVE